MSYTKKSLNIITLFLTILIFICLYLISSQISLLINSNYNSKHINSKIIPIQEQNKSVKILSFNNSITDNLLYYTNIKEPKSKKPKTQRQVVQANQTNNWRIQIPKINLDAHIKEGTNQDILLTSVGHFDIAPIWNGNVCLAAHNRGYLCNFFQKIKNLKIGDEIIYCTEKGKRIYKVQTNKVILATDWSYMENTKDNRITLITCEENRPEYRRCVQAVQIL